MFADEGVEDVTAVELTDGDEVEGGDEQPGRRVSQRHPFRSDRGQPESG